MQINEFKSRRGNRVLMVKFICERCGGWRIETLESCVQEEHYGYLHNTTPPKGWCELLHGPLLCPDCYERYKQFMAAGKEAEDGKE